MKSTHFSQVRAFTDIPNVGPAVAKDFHVLGIKTPAELSERDGYELYTQLCKKTGVRHDPCVLDTFLAVVDFMRGAAPKPWFAYTAERKRRYPNV